MWLVMCIIYLLSTTIYNAEAVSGDECQKPPKERHCLVEYASRGRVKHAVRYSYSWIRRQCIVIRWAYYCPLADISPRSNNFATEAECSDKCVGWA